MNAPTCSPLASCSPAASAARPALALRIHRLDLCSDADLDVLTPLFDAYRVFYEQPSDPARVRAFLRQRGERREAVVYLASAAAEGVALGYTLLYPSFSSVSTAPITILNDLYVVPQARGRGVGTALMDEAVRHARAQGTVRLSLTTARSNHTAQSVYEAHGWARDEVYLSYHRRPDKPLRAEGAAQ